MLCKFQSTPPERGATSIQLEQSKKQIVSIHAPREGSDPSFYRLGVAHRRFNPRPPRGERHDILLQTKDMSLFQSTPPERGATSAGSAVGIDGAVSIHAPREGSDAAVKGKPGASKGFNPRPPRGERL